MTADRIKNHIADRIQELESERRMLLEDKGEYWSSYEELADVCMYRAAELLRLLDWIARKEMEK
jgi:predicted transcriptional regulator